MSFPVRAVVLFLVTLAVYVPVMNGDFIWDDDRLLLNNPHMRTLRGLLDLWIAPKTENYYPVTYSFLWLQWQLFGADNPGGYHVVCILLHATSSVLVWRVLQLARVPGAWLAGLIFAIHPVCVESVSWISEIKNTLTLPFFLLSIIAWLIFCESKDNRRRAAYSLSLVMFALALLSKTSVVTLPVFLLFHAWWKRGAVTRSDIFQTLPFFVVSAILSVVTIIFEFGRAIGSEGVPIGGALSRIAGAGMALCFYLSKALLPIGTMIVYPRWPINPPVWWTFLFGIVFFCMSVWIYRNHKTWWGRPSLLALGFFTIMLAPVLGFVKLAYMRHTLVADHFQYVSVIGIVALVSAAASRGWEASKGTARYAIAAVVVAIIVLLGFESNRLAATYRNQETLWTEALGNNPDAWVGHNNLGGIKLERQDIAGASFHIHEARRLAPGLPETHYNLALLLSMTGKQTEACAESEEAVRLAPNSALFRVNWISMRIETGKLTWADAVKEYEECLRITPDDARANNLLALAYVAVGRFDEAIQSSERAVILAPKSEEFHNVRGLALSTGGQIQKAIESYRRAISLNANFTPSMTSLAWLLATNQVHSNPAEAVRLAEQAARLTEHKDAGTMDVLAAAYASAAEFSRAVEAANAAVSIARQTNQADQEKEFQARLSLYLSGKPYHESQAPQ
jgi:tetratricopeptide (TPR) repeat protein